MRPTAAKLLEHRFFRIAKKPDYVKNHLLANLPPLGERCASAKAAVPPIAPPDPELQPQKGHRRKPSSGWSFPEDLTSSSSSCDNTSAGETSSPSSHESRRKRTT